MWRLRLLGLHDWLALGLVAVVIGGFMLVNGQRRFLPNFGFGADWRCTYIGKGEPVCVKDPPGK